LILELTPVEANRILLAQNANALIDYLIRPFVPEITGPATVATPGVATTRLARTDTVIMPQLAPYSSRNGGAAAAKAGAKSTTTAGGGGGGGGKDRPIRETSSTYFPPVNSSQVGTTGVLPPLPVTQPDTYQIPIYVDGKVVRYDTVARPKY
jgi:hypothetical protein